MRRYDRSIPVKSFPYSDEHREERRVIFESRLRFFCSLTVGIYLTVSILGLLLGPASFKKDEAVTWGVLVAVAALSIFINRRVKTFSGAKLAAGIFSASLIFVLAWLFFIYPDYIMQSSEMLALGVFFISFVLPWSAFEVLFIGALSIAALTSIYARAISGIQNTLAADKLIFEQGGYIDGLIFLLVAICICAIIRRKDSARERSAFGTLKDLEAANAQMRDELAIARDVHKTLIPKSTTTEDAAIAVSYVPMSTVGGDYATFHVTDDGNLFFLIGDVTGHGVPAALLVNRIYGEIEMLIARNPVPGVLMRDLGGFVQEHFSKAAMYFSVCSGLIDFKAKKLFYSNCGHPPQILHQHRGNTISLLEPQTHLLGVESGEVNPGYYEGELLFDHKDRIVLFTDGLIETKGKDGDLFGMDRLEEFVKTRAAVAPTVFNAELLREADAFRVGPISDDLFLVTIDIK